MYQVPHDKETRYFLQKFARKSKEQKEGGSPQLDGKEINASSPFECTNKKEKGKIKACLMAWQVVA